MKFFSQGKLIAVSMASALMIGICGWGWWWFCARVLADDAARSGIRQKIERLAASRASAHAFAEFRDARQEDLSRIGAFFSDRSRPIALLQALEALGRATGNQIMIDIDDASSDDKYLAFRVSIEGSEQSILRYVRLLEHIPYQTKITAMNYERSPRDSRAVLSSGASGRLIVALRVRAQKQ